MNQGVNKLLMNLHNIVDPAIDDIHLVRILWDLGASPSHRICIWDIIFSSWKKIYILSIYKSQHRSITGHAPMRQTKKKTVTWLQ